MKDRLNFLFAILHSLYRVGILFILAYFVINTAIKHDTVNCIIFSTLALVVVDLAELKDATPK